ncbi:hypothetical protein B0A52_04225 [Exophiala mesophila]|uniref:Pyroglutamyl peptidase type I n=1 Tax=Exophiala mesophila TaxID=212818 RepID=A0A438N8B3_EXOME|nr:hypothetical protein B0A52_04225 [Exophiala mesophila]
MGDAGPPTPPPGLDALHPEFDTTDSQHPPLREVKVLVTGFGPFKSFLVNPSWLITSSLPNELYLQAPSSNSPAPAYKIRLIVYPEPIRVTYPVLTSLVPSLIKEHDPDYILHIGMAAGRDCYSLETRAHRDGYRIKDVDEGDGFSCGEVTWKREGLPDLLMTEWDEDEVLKRWDEGVGKALKANANTTSNASAAVQPPRPISGPLGLMWSLTPGAATVTPTTTTSSIAPVSRADDRKRSVVKLSRDAGRFICEFALFESLSRRWLDDARHHRRGPSGEVEQSKPDTKNEANNTTDDTSSTSSRSSSSSPEHDLGHRKRLAHERLGKVAFLHVPGWTGVEDIARGTIVAQEAIRALVTSWEDGYRRSGRVDITPAALNQKKFTTQNSEIRSGVEDLVVTDGVAR